jgi:hypothetical protein
VTLAPFVELGVDEEAQHADQTQPTPIPLERCRNRRVFVYVPRQLLTTVPEMPLNETYTLTTLLPSTPYLLAYSLPLLFLSILLTFAGTFLTLDRSRSFPPRYDTIPGSFDRRNKTKFNWLLEGGIGGLAAGYAFGGTFHQLLRNLFSLSRM